MTITHSLARSFIAPIFVAGGMDALKNPDEKAKKADQVIGRVASTLGLPDDPVKLVRINGGVQLVAGAMLAIGWAPRLSAGVLAASLVPTTIAGHRFWEEPDPQKKAAQRIELMKNLAMLGGLVLAATDHDGNPSLTWRAKRSASKAAGRASSAMSSASDLVSGHSHNVSHTAAGLGHSAAGFGEKALAAAAVLGERALHMASSAAETAGQTASHFAEVAGERATHFAGSAGQFAETVGERAVQTAGAAGHAAETSGACALHAVTHAVTQAATRAASSAADAASSLVG